jgi:hypothetical protein
LTGVVKGTFDEFQVKTQSQDAVLFYNTGPSSNKDFVALEIAKGKPRLLVDQVIKQLTLFLVLVSNFTQLHLVWTAVFPRNGEANRIGPYLSV